MNGLWFQSSTSSSTDTAVIFVLGIIVPSLHILTVLPRLTDTRKHKSSDNHMQREGSGPGFHHFSFMEWKFWLLCDDLVFLERSPVGQIQLIRLLLNPSLIPGFHYRWETEELLTFGRFIWQKISGYLLIFLFWKSKKKPTGIENASLIRKIKCQSQE